MIHSIHIKLIFFRVDFLELWALKRDILKNDNIVVFNIAIFSGQFPKNFSCIIMISIFASHKYVVIINLHCLQQQNEK